MSVLVQVVMFLHPDAAQMPLIKDLWAKLGMGSVDYRPFGYVLKAIHGSSMHLLVEEFVNQHNIRHSSRTEAIYSEEDLVNHELFRLVVTTYAGSGADTYGTEFDKGTACPACGTGMTQMSPLVIDKKEMGSKDLAITYEFEHLVSERVGAALHEGGCSGLDLRPVKHKSDRPGKHSDLPVFQLVPSSIMPPLVEPTGLMKSRDYCSICGRRGLFLRSEPYYKREGLVYSDVNFTAEHFGEGQFPHRYVIVSSKVCSILRSLKVRNFQVEPVRLI